MGDGVGQERASGHDARIGELIAMLERFRAVIPRPSNQCRGASILRPFEAEHEEMVKELANFAARWLPAIKIKVGPHGMAHHMRTATIAWNKTGGTD